jgi:hypothetical protein
MAGRTGLLLCATMRGDRDREYEEVRVSQKIYNTRLPENAKTSLETSSLAKLILKRAKTSLETKNIRHQKK